MKAPYLRVSTEEQREKQTIENQRRFAERYFAAQNISIYDWYVDDGISGTIPLEQRPEGSRLLNDVKAGRIDTVFVVQLDRLGRDSLVILNAISMLESLNCKVQSMKESFDTTNPTGRFLVTILGGVASLERDTIVERSVEGTNRLARSGAWVGGIVPYGYRVIGVRQESRLVVSEQLISGFQISEAEVVRIIYRMSAEDHKSCRIIAEYLNTLGIPHKTVQDESDPVRGKRLQKSTFQWTTGYIRNMIVSTTYKGLHRYGRHTKKQRDIFEREVPAIVSPEIWERAQQTLRDNAFVSEAERSTRDYLLHGLIKCGLCNLTYGGTSQHPYKNTERAYYRCIANSQLRGIFGAQGKKCPSKSVNALVLESAVWKDIEAFLRDPGTVIEQLAAQMQMRAGEMERLREELAGHQHNLQALDTEKGAVITLFRKGRIDESDLDRQLDQIQQEEAAAQIELADVQNRLHNIQEKEDGLRGAQEQLNRLLQKLLEEPLTWELRRDLVETLVEEIRVDTVHDDRGQKEAQVTVIYRFGPSTAIGTDMDSWKLSA